jgi:hypothetical protein
MTNTEAGWVCFKLRWESSSQGRQGDPPEEIGITEGRFLCEGLRLFIIRPPAADANVAQASLACSWPGPVHVGS